jgi:hypothetical protein
MTALGTEVRFSTHTRQSHLCPRQSSPHDWKDVPQGLEPGVEKVPEGRLKIRRYLTLDNFQSSLRDLSCLESSPQDCVLG